PREVLLYFNYDNGLPVDRRALLYAYVIRHKEDHPEVFRAYENIMKAFTHEQLTKAYVDRHMIELYRYFINGSNISRKVTQYLPNILFKHEVTCGNLGIRGVVVSQREIDKEKYYPINNMRAYVDIYMEDYNIALVDDDNNRYTTTVPYQVVPLIRDQELIKECYNADQLDPMVVLNRSEKAIKYQKTDELSIDMYMRVLRLPDISKTYQKSILKNLIDFYYDNYEGMTLEKYLMQLDISLLDRKERCEIIEYYIQRGIFDKAYSAVEIYGYEGIDAKRLMKLCSRMIREDPGKEDPLLIEMSYAAFSAGKYDELILNYLNRFYLGTTSDFYAIWKAARNFEVPAGEIEEKMLCQVLFSEAFITQGEQVFESYYQGKPDDRIVKAFLAFYAYVYLVKGQKPAEKMFDFMLMEREQMEGARDVCGLALLKYYAENAPKDERNKPWIYDEAGRFMAKGIVLPFFSAFADDLRMPKEILNYTYAQYVTDPRNTVDIHYIFSDGRSEGKNFVEEDMRNVYNGIFVKGFTLYAGEQIRCYMTEKSELSESITENSVLKASEKQDIRGTVYSRLNDMIRLSDEGKTARLRKEIDDLENKKKQSRELFALID
ncbi:MAG: hypothetical protein IJL97_04650, partial [Lachnospiraceae bacterium]|nr:hypothetical protein [Lachnospiraceae bacterium]